MAAFKLQSRQNITRLYCAMSSGAYLIYPLDNDAVGSSFNGDVRSTVLQRTSDLLKHMPDATD